MQVEEESGVVEKFDWAVEGILLPLVCLVGIIGTHSYHHQSSSPKEHISYMRNLYYANLVAWIMHAKHIATSQVCKCQKRFKTEITHCAFLRVFTFLAN